MRRLVERAEEMGFEAMPPSALSRHAEALALYRAEEFVPDPRPPDAGNASNAVQLRRDLRGPGRPPA